MYQIPLQEFAGDIEDLTFISTCQHEYLKLILSMKGQQSSL